MKRREWSGSRIVFWAVNMVFGVVCFSLLLATPACNEPNPDALTGATQPTGGSSIYPHSKNFANAEQHGKYVIANSLAQCQGCHGYDSKGGSSGVSCFRCHALYPHTDGYATAAKHGQFVLENGTGGCATRCHGADLRGGDSGVSCDSCHAPYPHRWSDGEGHGDYVKQHGLSTCQTQCHGTNLSGGGSGVSCFQCHEDFDDD